MGPGLTLIILGPNADPGSSYSGSGLGPFQLNFNSNWLTYSRVKARDVGGDVSGRRVRHDLIESDVRDAGRKRQRHVGDERR